MLCRKLLINKWIMGFLMTTFLSENRTGSGWLSSSGGNGFAGGGGGRISINVFSRHDDTEFFVHGRFSVL